MLKSAVVCNGNFRVFVDGSINQIADGKETSARTYYAGRTKKYKFVKWVESGKPKFAYVHRLVAEAFIPNPNNKREVHHKDGNTQNNAANNLEWLTRSESTKRAYENGFIQPMRNGKPCKRCGCLTRTKAQICERCARKIISLERAKTKARLQVEKYQDYDTFFLTDREAECVEMAKTGLREQEIATLLGLSRQRIHQLLEKAEEKQYVHP